MKYSYLPDNEGQIPQTQGCIFKNQVSPKLRFVSERFGDPEYGLLYHHIDYRIRERGPSDNAMGAFGFLQEANKWRNLKVRFREYLPIGINPVFIVET